MLYWKEIYTSNKNDVFQGISFQVLKNEKRLSGKSRVHTTQNYHEQTIAKKKKYSC